MKGLRRAKTAKSRSICVGILTVPHSHHVKYGSAHIIKTYVDWFEDRGVRVIPIPYDTAEHEKYFRMVNGIIIPGGETTFLMKNTVYISCCQRFLDLAIQATDRGEYFPIWGTCFGYEILLALIGRFNSFNRYPFYDLAPLHITRSGHQSRMFSGFSKTYLRYLEKYPSTLNNHTYGMSPKEFMENKSLRKFYRILATSIDKEGKEYIAAIEGRDYPIYGVQWHPERQNTSAPFVEFFISELAKSRHRLIHVPHSIRTTMKAKRCAQYPELTDWECYFF
jgi:gamma-glutamyl hydrolase